METSATPSLPPASTTLTTRMLSLLTMAPATESTRMMTLVLLTSLTSPRPSMTQLCTRSEVLTCSRPSNIKLRSRRTAPLRLPLKPRRRRLAIGTSLTPSSPASSGRTCPLFLSRLWRLSPTPPTTTQRPTLTLQLMRMSSTIRCHSSASPCRTRGRPRNTSSSRCKSTSVLEVPSGGLSFPTARVRTARSN